jgi:pSer/pThr/pTyr-binding forkhead associated (FHA) protein
MSAVAYFEVKSPKRGAKLRLDAPFFVIGRGERIPIFHDDPSISREHAAVVIRKTGVRIRDLGSRNGVLLNGEPMARYSEADLKPGDSLKVGGTTLVLREGEPPPQEPKPVEAPRHETLELPSVSPVPDAAAVDASMTGSAMTGVNIPIKDSAKDSAEDQPVHDLSKIEEREALPPVTSSSEDSVEEVDDAEEVDAVEEVEPDAETPQLE